PQCESASSRQLSSPHKLFPSCRRLARARGFGLSSVGILDDRVAEKQASMRHYVDIDLPVVALKLVSNTAEAIMRNRNNVAVATLPAGGLLRGGRGAAAEDRPAVKKPFVAVPDTVSAEARKYLESLPDPATLPAWLAADDRVGWKRAW